MLVEFRVENFKNFQNELVFRLDQTKNYEFNLGGIKDQIIKTSLVYGENGSGKSNLGLAIIDLVHHLTDSRIEYHPDFNQMFNSVNGESVKFYYRFKFYNTYLVYKYEKNSLNQILSEELLIDDERVISYNHLTYESDVKLDGAEKVNRNLNGKNISFIKYLSRHAILEGNLKNNVFGEFIDFVEDMLYVDSLDRNLDRSNDDFITKVIIGKRKLKDFEQFLKRVGVEYTLSEEGTDILCDFNGRTVNFLSVTSSGIYALTLLYSRLINPGNISLIYIDDFDAYYENELASLVVRGIREGDFQSILTTHNTGIISSGLLSPDCYFNLTNGNISSFPNSTNKELRKEHNIERMYRAGSFDN